MKMSLVITTYFQDIARPSYDCQTRLQLTFKPHTTLIPQAMASPAQEQNKQVVRQFFEAFDRHDTERIEHLLSSTNYSFHSLDMPPIDWNGHKQFIIAITNAFPDIHHDIVDLVAEGEDKVAVRFDATATHKGEFQSIPPTSKKVSFGGMNFFTIIDGKVAEEWVIVDMMGLMQQIGAIPAPHASSSASSSAASS